MMVRSQDDVILPIGYWGDVHGVTVPHPFLYIKMCSVCVPLRHCCFLMALSSYFFESGNQSRFFVIIVVVCVAAWAVCIVLVSISIGFSPVCASRG